MYGSAIWTPRKKTCEQQNKFERKLLKRIADPVKKEKGV